jgi:adenylate cyclase
VSARPGLFTELKRRNAEAEEKIRLAQANGWPVGVRLFTIELAARGEGARAAEFLRSTLDAEALESPVVLAVLAALEDPAQASALPEEIGDIDEALISLGREDQFLDGALAFARRPESYQSFWLRMAWQPSWAGVREDPRFFQIARELGYVELWETRGYPPGCVRVAASAGDRLDCPGMRR